MATDWNAYVAQQQKRPGLASSANQLTGALGSQRPAAARAWDPAAQQRGQSVAGEFVGAPTSGGQDLDAGWRSSVGGQPQMGQPAASGWSGAQTPQSPGSWGAAGGGTGAGWGPGASGEAIPQRPGGWAYGDAIPQRTTYGGGQPADLGFTTGTWYGGVPDTGAGLGGSRGNIAEQLGALTAKLPTGGVGAAMDPMRRGTVGASGRPGPFGGQWANEPYMLTGPSTAGAASQPQDPAMAAHLAQVGMAPGNPNPYGTGIPQPHVISGSQYGADGRLGLEDLGNPNLSATDQRYLAGLGYYHNPTSTAAQQNAANWGVSGVSAPLTPDQGLATHNAQQALQQQLAGPAGASSK